MRSLLATLLATSALIAVSPAHAQKKYGPGVTDTEIKLGQTISYSGPISFAGMFGKVMVGYINDINERGGINGRKINMLSVDDGCSPPKAVEMTRKLVEGDQVLAMVGSNCTGTQVAVQKYLNSKQVPQLFVAAAGPTLFDHKNFPWTVAFNYAYEFEGEAFGNYINKHRPNGKIAVLYQNDDAGKAWLSGMKRSLGDRAKSIVKEQSYELTDVTIDSQILALRESGADVLVDMATSKYVAMTIRKLDSMGWKPIHLIPNSASAVGATLAPAGLDKSKGIFTTTWLKAPSDPTWKNDPGMQAYLAFMRKRIPASNPDDTIAVFAYALAQATELMLRRAGDDLTRENLIKVATSFKDVDLPILQPGIKINISPDNRYPVRTARFAEFDGATWVTLKD
ncbi:MAG: ABC transporter substrate-binding protein [Burkholderiaceae bacterium]|nr:ABC transporter substrate-binding protein [Burkholderiaceae bacterium]